MKHQWIESFLGSWYGCKVCYKTVNWWQMVRDDLWNSECPGSPQTNHVTPSNKPEGRGTEVGSI